MKKKYYPTGKKTDAFNRSVSERPEDKPFVFYDGPPFATGKPHYGHIVGSTMKDVVPRYMTMQGHRVERKWGWDCHGLPIENIVEKELGTKSKKDITEFGVGKFNELCRSKVLGYVDEWKNVVARLGRWADMDNAYKTMDLDFMESVWWVFKQLWDKDLIYQGYRPMHICPRCETTLSQQEVSEGYKSIKDLSVTAQFKITEESKLANDHLKSFSGDVFVLAWTTTPWTLPGNVLLAVGEDITYTAVTLEGNTYLIAKERLMDSFEGKEFEVVSNMSGKDLVGLAYEPLFPYFADSENAFKIVFADFVTTENGTGVVHIAPAFGTDDYEMFKKEGVPFIQHVLMDGTFIPEVTDFAGMHVKPIDDHMATDVHIIKWLAHNGKLFSKKKYEHSYPHCWRCDTPLLNYATSSWFVAVTKVKENALEYAKNINWSPEHIKEGRFGKWLEGARDWSISRQRFWASAIPIWECDGCDARDVIGSVKELEDKSGETVTDIHKHIVDELTYNCSSCSGIMKRVPDVLDTWFDSGSMPYAQMHYPFENKDTFEAGFPAEFIAEGVDQTRAWFYYLHALGTAIMDKPAFSNVIVNGIVLAEDGKKMSKRLQNYPDPTYILDTYGADALRFYLLTSPVMQAENLSFSEDGVREVFSKVMNTLHNVVTFYEMFEKEVDGDVVPSSASTHVLDAWILSSLAELRNTMTDAMSRYHLPDATRPVLSFVQDLSQWYVRRSRDRMKGSDAAEKQACLETLKFVLAELSKLLAPFTPFIAEHMYQTLDGSLDSVHLELWPEEYDFADEQVLQTMEQVRKVVELGMSLRKEHGLKVRQPLGAMSITGITLDIGYNEMILSELNVKGVQESISGSETVTKEEHDLVISLDTKITESLAKEGMVREIVRAVNSVRKQKGYTRDDRIVIHYASDSEIINAVFEQFTEELKNAVLADDITAGEGGDIVKINGETMQLTVEKK